MPTLNSSNLRPTRLSKPGCIARNSSPRKVDQVLKKLGRGVVAKELTPQRREPFIAYGLVRGIVEPRVPNRSAIDDDLIGRERSLELGERVGIERAFNHSLRVGIEDDVTLPDVAKDVQAILLDRCAGRPTASRSIASRRSSFVLLEGGRLLEKSHAGPGDGTAD
jgi:hypothetical protein